MVDRILDLEPGQLRRAWPFFALYLTLFAALTLADGLAWALFVARVGADRLPQLQASSALCVMLSLGWYLRAAGRRRSERVFQQILVGPLALFVAIGGGLAWGTLDARGLGLLFLGREVAFALVLLHFGAFLQDYFTRAELNRVMPFIYAGGRVGGIAGGAALEHLSQVAGPARLFPLLAALLAVSMAGVWLIHRFAAMAEDTEEGTPNAMAPPRRGPAEAAAPTGALREFLAQLWRSPLLFWITVSTAALFVCRAGLTFQCGQCWQREFASEAELARFLGRYTQLALAASLLFQLLLVSRMIAWLGLRGAQLTYAALIVLAALGGWGEMTLAAAVFARFVEGELRFGLRNPVAQMTVNLFPKQVRTQVRAWSLGVLIPVSTLAASLVLGVLVRWEAAGWIAAATCAAGLGYFAASLGLAARIEEPRRGLTPPLTSPTPHHPSTAGS